MNSDTTLKFIKNFFIRAVIGSALSIGGIILAMNVGRMIQEEQKQSQVEK